MLLSLKKTFIREAKRIPAMENSENLESNSDWNRNE